MCVSLYYFPDSRRSCYSCRIWNLYGSVRIKTSMNGVYKTNIDCASIREMIKNHWALGKIQTWPTIHLGPTGRASVNSRSRLNFTSGTLRVGEEENEKSLRKNKKKLSKYAERMKKWKSCPPGTVRLATALY